jgi:flagellar hook protein FlgE
VSQYAQTSGESNPQQDGYAAGQVTSVGISNGGLLVATYSNGQQSTVGQLAMASIANPNSLLSVGDNNLQASASTSAVALGAANTAGNGQIVGGSLEGSTADMATQFTNLLTYERSYQAASRVITTADQLLQETVDLIHP